MQQVDERHFFKPALHRGPAALLLFLRCRGALEVLLGGPGVDRRRSGSPRDQLEDARPDENPVAFLELRTADLLAVDERAVGGPQIADGDTPRGERQLRMLARDHVLDQHQVQLAGAADHELTGISQRVLASLIFSRDEAECVGVLAHAGLGCERASLR